MRLSGRIHDWNDERGFGFVTPSGGGDKAFVHIKAWSGSGRPHDGLLVSYATRRDGRGRLNAHTVKAVRAAARPRRSGRLGAGSQRWRIACGAGLLALEASAAALGPGWRAAWVVLLALGLATAVLYAGDKRAATRGQWRTPESTLHLFGLAGGWPGALLAQGLLRHKTAKPGFQAVFWLSVVLNLAALGALLQAPPQLLQRLAGG